MSHDHTGWQDFRKSRSARRDPEVLAAGYVEADFAIRLGEAVYQRRKELGLSPVELGRRAGMTRTQVSRLETGGPLPALNTLGRLAEALKVRLVVELGDPARQEAEMHVPVIAA